MKKFSIMILTFLLLLSVTACGDALVDLDTPKSKELSEQYDFYSDSMNTIRGDMGVTPEQADEIFIVLVASGLNGKVSSITGSSPDFTVRYGGGTFGVKLEDSVVVEVTSGSDVLYPVSEEANPLLAADLQVADVKNGTRTETIGQRGYIEVAKEDLQAVTQEEYAAFVDQRVDDSGYNWVSIMCDDGTGICFIGSMGYVAEYGKMDSEGTITEIMGNITVDTDGTYMYESAE